IVQNWIDLNIFPEFSAGNINDVNRGGPGSIVAPANYPESFATGATDKDDELAEYSLRGPSPYGEVKPDVSAPGSNIRSSLPGGGYGVYSGTSMAGPAVSGAVALLRGANNGISVGDLKEILTDTAIPRTDNQYDDVPNNGYGHGIIDAYSAIMKIKEGTGRLEGTVSDMNQAALDAYVNIEGSKQSVRTKEDGSYALLLDAGEYTAVADAYGYESKEQDISIEVDEIVQVDFNLEALDKFEVV